ncbi:hypothetical protein BDF21DRAFT_405129 [Thamnidium elegans]|nr:hypothetical protein BDF21DRAFT_405129 [Thamnidium elegans]
MNYSEDRLPINLELMSNKLLKDDRVKDVIVKSLLGLRSSGSMYSINSSNWVYRPVSDVLYVPKAQCYKNFPPIFVAVQKIVDSTFMEKIILYSISLYEEYKILPILLIISVEEFSNEDVKSKFQENEGVALMEINCAFWANSCYLLWRESILNVDDGSPVDTLIALASCVINAENSSQSDSPAINYFFEIAYE